MVAPITEEAKAAMLANFDLEINARKEKLRAMCEAQCASLRSRLERRVNRVPATKRQMPLIELLAPPPPPVKSAPAPLASEDKENATVDLAVPKKRVRAATTTTKQPAVTKPAAPAARSTRAASRKTAPAEVLSPKNNNARAKPATRSIRPR
ncbi:hypothetical protein EJ07DRAFT_120359 [Lizonia empirigonia]|nr:hypothetical protein EJ07DRAFT_120359 [Lizonia empirigonia]